MTQATTSEVRRFRFVVNLILLAIKTNKLGLFIETALACWKARLAWDEAMERLSGEFYGRQVKQAAEKFRNEHDDLFKCRVNVRGYARWKAENEKTAESDN